MTDSSAVAAATQADEVAVGRRRPLRTLLATGPGRAGAVMLALLGAVSLVVVITFPADFGPARWSNPLVWADNPRSAPPAWTGWFSGTARAPHLVLADDRPQEAPVDGGRVETHRMPFRFAADEAPTFLSVSLAGVSYAERPPTVVVTLHRPDGAAVPLLRHVPPGPRPGEQAPHLRYAETPHRVVLGSEPEAIEGARTLLVERFGASVTAEQVRGRVEEILFGVLRPDGRLEVLDGDYLLEARIGFHGGSDAVDRVGVVVGGATFGLMGTDALGRDLFQGLLFGLPVALLIGLVASTLSTGIGAGLGLVSGYRGGRTDTLIQRAADVVANVPVLPLLIFLVFVLGSRLWVILLVLVAFGWPGLTIVVRSMVLQLRDSPEVEAAKALGASGRRIVTRHVFPHLAPFVSAQLIFFAPSAILAEAGLSFLGLGDPSIPTWGQILEAGFSTGAVFLGYWWWVVPPGLAIVITALTFMLLALGSEPAVSPRLRPAIRGPLTAGKRRFARRRPLAEPRP
jgi:peptide/nickel transport system permease protein